MNRTGLSLSKTPVQDPGLSSALFQDRAEGMLDCMQEGDMEFCTLEMLTYLYDPRVSDAQFREAMTDNAHPHLETYLEGFSD